MHPSLLYIKHVFWICIILLNLKVSHSQEIYYKSYNTSNGLPSTQVYDIKIDENGNLWYATDFGVGRYDGFEFKNYTIADGLPINSNIRLYEDQKGRMWFHGYSGDLSYFEQEEIIQYPYNKQLTNFTYDNYVHKIYVDSDDNITISPMPGGVSKFYADGTIDHLDIIVNPIKYCYFLINDHGDETFTSIINDRNIPIDIDSSRTIRQLRIPFKYKSLAFHRYLVKLDSLTYLISYGNELNLIQDGEIIRRKIYKDQVAGIMLDANQNLWVTLMYGQGVHMYPEADLRKEPVKYFKGKTITKVVQDREGNYWFASVGEGLLYTPSMDYKIYRRASDGHDLNILSMDRYHDEIYVSTIDKHLYKFNIVKGIAEEKNIVVTSDLSNWIFDIEVDDTGNIWVASAYDMRIDSMGLPLPPDTVFTIFEIEEGRGGHLLLGSNMLSICDENTIKSYPSDDFNRRIYALHEDRDGIVWIGTLAGLHKFDGREYQFMGKDILELGKRINCISSIRDYVIIGSGSFGLLFYKEDSIYRVVNKASGLVSDAVNELYFDADSTLWVGTNRGLSKIAITGFDSLAFEIDNITSIDGLPAEHINEILTYDGHIWLGTDQGLVSFDPDKIRDSDIAPPIEITSVQINNRDTVLMDEYVLESFQNNIRIHFKSVSFKGQNNIIYRYLMWNLNEEIILTNNTYVDFPNLPSGDYTFLVNAGFKDGIWNEAPQFINIRIKKHFTETIWFIGLVIVVGLLVIAFIVLKIIQIERRKEERKKELIILENKFFRSQLNPHFIFNALLAIQSFIYKKEPDEAVRYLTNFAKLVRYILSIADDETISLDQELQFIKNYLELQKLRFSNKFDYTINIAPEINPEMIQVPSLLAQPFIENAIEHGIQLKPSRGKLDINISTEGHSINLEVVDDGIGREASMELYKKRKDKHKSYGISIIEQRIALMNKIMDNSIKIEISDLMNGEEAAGTRVNIRIPMVNDQ